MNLRRSRSFGFTLLWQYEKNTTACAVCWPSDLIIINIFVSFTDPRFSCRIDCLLRCTCVFCATTFWQAHTDVWFGVVGCGNFSSLSSARLSSVFIVRDPNFDDPRVRRVILSPSLVTPSQSNIFGCFMLPMLRRVVFQYRFDFGTLIYVVRVCACIHPFSIGGDDIVRADTADLVSSEAQQLHLTCF
jgi:hypothetical protein